MRDITTRSHCRFYGVGIVLLIVVSSTLLAASASASSSSSSPPLFKAAYAQTDSNQDIRLLFEQAYTHLLDAEYKQAITVYDDILDISQNNIQALNMKGIAYNGLQEYNSSLEQFFTVLQYRPDDPTALTGMGVGFGNLGEYQESISYFEEASNQRPDSVIINNYKDVIDKIIIKYPYTPTEKPASLTPEDRILIPEWVKTVAGWWTSGDMSYREFVEAFAYLVEKDIVRVPPITSYEIAKDRVTLEETKRYTKSWSENQITDEEFATDGIKQIIAKSPAEIQIQFQRSQTEIDQEFNAFKQYLRDITNSITKEKRYIEYSNPSNDVIKKFLRDYKQWNFEEEVKVPSGRFPTPTYEIVDGTYIVTYNVFVNRQPSGLPLDHTSTLENSFEFWEGKELFTEDATIKIKFKVTDVRHEANVWVTWVVRDLGEGVLGHAHLGKGIVEVTLGDYRCDGSFQLYDVGSVEYIMTHELGHSINLVHSDDPDSIMYPGYSPSYAYCLLY